MRLGGLHQALLALNLGCGDIMCIIGNSQTCLVMQYINLQAAVQHSPSDFRRDAIHGNLGL